MIVEVYFLVLLKEDINLLNKNFRFYYENRRKCVSSIGGGVSK